ncbi:hypothetical protein CDQ84_03710 [Clostridium thermosuccinogenes]|uniref:Uncharacterized protein n=1 Tax=Clostridium thermosuccinogenes TaxID=84032 RepID=A0A2K2FK86_9CLOT|nr:glycosyltransferase [Pseudoclostridium thermosuccinogenes]AUS95090.1 hypothetical protein CDO33_00670 [Pseudoclostridium thermosuccinogenes]PNT99190.1 hypothetical protein CDQ85_03710 [Pseudoclostridium thermosuccinogenes]PNU00993.1 hypothetical protein CDQ84_03710 [Pseudoclostridium thermosuccinogenes]
MNDKKICFISCVNDHELYREALFYINQLEVPEGYEIECISVENAESMAQGYNEAMKASDAKYKVYLHQDVYIRNRFFIRDIINIFKSDDRIGMIGVIGSKTIPPSGIWWESGRKCGKVFDSHTGEMQLLSYGDVQSEYDIVQAIDGLIMITQYDVPWREDIFDGWHFYDISQCIEFNMRGYKVSIPRQEQPWVIHDCGLVNVRNGYDKYRSIFVSEYSKFSIFTDGENDMNFYSFGINSRIDRGYDIFCPEGISIGNNVLIQRDCWLMLPFNNFYGSPRIVIGDGCDIGRRCNISAANRIELEKNVLVAPNVHISDHNHAYDLIGIPIKNQGIDSFNNEVVIGEGSWIGINSVIVGNVHIGKGSVIGANSVVIDDLPEYCVAAGNPAKVIKLFDRVSGKWIRVKDKEHLDEILKARETASPLLSICIPTFNRAKKLEKCLNSIYSQIGNDSNFEIVISDNNSPDNTKEVVEKYKATYSNINYYKNDTNIGPERNFISCIKKANGKYVLLHGDDDYFKAGTLYKLLNIIMKISNCSLYFINVLKDDQSVEILEGLDVFLKETSINSTFASSILFSKEEFDCIDDICKFIGSSINHLYWQFMLLKKNPTFCLINESIFYQDKNENSGYNYGEVFIKNYLAILNYFVEDGSLSAEVVKEDKKKILDSTIFYWYKYILDNNLDLDVSNLENIFIEHYKDEPYFEKAHSIIKAIKYNR